MAGYLVPVAMTSERRFWLGIVVCYVLVFAAGLALYLHPEWFG